MGRSTTATSLVTAVREPAAAEQLEASQPPFLVAVPEAVHQKFPDLLDASRRCLSSAARAATDQLHTASTAVATMIPGVPEAAWRSITEFRDQNMPYFWACAAAGAISTATTHSAFFPLDVLKTKMQSDAALAGLSAQRALRHVLRTDGPRHLLSGFSANAMGYFSQGAIKFGLYETGKHACSTFLESRWPETVDATEARWRVPIWIVSSACAEVVASFALCPMEATKIRLVTDRTYARGAAGAFRRLVREEGLAALFRGSAPILIRQVPYTVAKLAGYEALSMLIGGGVVAGVVAGAAAAAVSQPGDVILSKLCGGSKVARLETCYLSVPAVIESLSVGQLFAGLTPRATMCAAICAGQFFLYEALRPAKPEHLLLEKNRRRTDDDDTIDLS